MLTREREHKDKLPGIKLPESIICSTDLEYSMEETGMIILVVPSQTVRESCKRLAALVKDQGVVVCFSKGLENGSGLRMSQVIGQEIPQGRVVAMSGPCHAEELAKGIPSAYVAASESKEAARLVQDVFMSSGFRVYTNADIVGVELGGALKNVIAICAGISDGLGYGDNTKAALMTRGIAEITRLGVAMGAKSQTFSGLTGVGDLIVTCTSMHSRNRRAGILIGQGVTPEKASRQVRMVVEGITTTKAAKELLRQVEVSMPIVDEAYSILFEGKDPKSAVAQLMGREKKHETEGDVFESNW